MAFSTEAMEKLKAEGGEIDFTLPFQTIVNMSGGNLFVQNENGEYEEWNLGNPAEKKDGEFVIEEGRSFKGTWEAGNDSAALEIILSPTGSFDDFEYSPIVEHDNQTEAEKAGLAPLDLQELGTYLWREVYDEDGELVEIGNNVFMEYLLEENKYKPLGRHNVDFGGGLERITTIVQEVDSFYDTDIYSPILEKIKSISEEQNLKSQRIIVDHIKASVLIIMDGIKPGPTQQSYILRRLIRRAVRHGKLLKISKPFTRDISKSVITQFVQIYPELESKKEEILNTIEQEELRFNKTIENGLRELDKELERKKEITGKKAFQLYETYGLPIEVTEEILREKGETIKNKDHFYSAQEEHQKKSRTSSKGMFKGGLSDTSEMTVKYHTATHLLLSSLRKILGEHIYQKGSNITPERLRLDFPSEKKLTEQEIKKVENLVNEIIENAYDVSFEEKPKEEALEIIKKYSGIASFTERYGDLLKIYYVGPKDNPISVEICNGPHVQNTKDLGIFKIVKQENVGAGIKRIKAILE